MKPSSLPKGLRESLDPDEEVYYMVKKKFAVEKPKWLVVTSKRIIYFDEKILGRYTIEAIPYEKLEKIIYHGGITTSKFIIKTEDNKEINLSWMDKEKSKKAITAIYNAIRSIAIEPPTLNKKKNLMSEDWTLTKPKETIVRTHPTTQQTTNNTSKPSKNDPITLLQKLKELKDTGIIDNNEYEDKKRKLLNKI